MLTFTSGGERPFIDGEWRAVREDHGVILIWLSMEGDLENIENRIGRYHLEIGPQR